MIGEALYALLLSLSPVTALVGEEITWAAFNAGGLIPALSYNAQNIKPLACRSGGATKTGLVEIRILANNEVELEHLHDVVIEQLDGFDGEVQAPDAMYSLVLDLSSSEFDDKVIDLGAFHKVILFDFIATKLT